MPGTVELVKIKIQRLIYSHSLLLRRRANVCVCVVCPIRVNDRAHAPDVLMADVLLNDIHF